MSNVSHAAASTSSGQMRDAAISAEEAGMKPLLPGATTPPSTPAPAAAPAPAPAPQPEPAPVLEPTPAAPPAEQAPAPAPEPDPAPAADPASDPVDSSLTGNHQTGQASWYDTIPGTCAHTTASRGTTVYVTNLQTGITTTCRVADYGPKVPGRVIDLSRTTFSELADPRQGVMPVSVDW
jgi:outer membrane biosynthesis protein TonB